MKQPPREASPSALQTDSAKKVTKNQVLAALVLQDSNFRQFAFEHHYKPRSVQQAVDRYVGTDKKPRGILTYKILRDLSKKIGTPVIEGLAELTN